MFVAAKPCVHARAREGQDLAVDCATGLPHKLLWLGCSGRGHCLSKQAGKLRLHGEPCVELGGLILLRFTVLRPCMDRYKDAP